MVTSTMVAGEFLMKDRKLIYLDEQEIYAQAHELSQKTWQRFKNSI